jgi:hypothetical protein
LRLEKEKAIEDKKKRIEEEKASREANMLNIEIAELKELQD